MDPQQAARLRAFWKKGRDHYRSFFCELEVVRKEVGDKRLSSWCDNHLEISLSEIDAARRLIGGIDAANLKRDFAAAAAAAKAQRKAEQEKSKAERQQQRKAHQQHQQRKRERPAAGTSPSVLEGLLAQWLDADKQCSAGIQAWIEGSVAKAKILCAMRAALPADRDFGAWADENGLALNKNDRAALIGLGRLEETELRVILTKTDSRSYPRIWEAFRPLKSHEMTKRPDINAAIEDAAKVADAEAARISKEWPKLGMMHHTSTVLVLACQRIAQSIRDLKE